MTNGEIVEDLYLRYRSKIYGYLYNHLRNREDAEDLLSEVFAKIVEKIDSYDSSKATYSTWIFTITRNTLISHYRSGSSGGERTDYEDLVIVDTGETPEESYLRTDSMNQLAESLEQLPKRDRDIIIARYYYDYSFKKIGELMGLTEGNARVIHTRAVEKLKKIYEKNY